MVFVDEDNPNFFSIVVDTWRNNKSLSFSEALKATEAKYPMTFAKYWPQIYHPWMQEGSLETWAADVYEAVHGRRVTMRRMRKPTAIPAWITSDHVYALYRKEGLTPYDATQKVFQIWPDLIKADKKTLPTKQTATTRQTEEHNMNNAPRRFEDAVKSYMDKGHSRAESVGLAATNHPDLHEEFLERSQREAVRLPLSGRR